MKYTVKGTIGIRIPEDYNITANGDNKYDAIAGLIEEMVEDGSLKDWLVLNNVEVKRVHKVFKVEVREVYVHTVEIDTDEYEDIENERDAEMYVYENLEEFTDDFDYDEYEREDYDTNCSSRDTVEDVEEDDD